MQIRPLQTDDRTQWMALWASYNAFYGRSGPTALEPAVNEVTWNRFFDAYEPMSALVAESDGQLLGLAHYLLHRSTITIAPSCYLQDLFVDPSARGRGVARALIAAVYTSADAAGAARIYWQTHEDNAVARRLYDGVAENSGFIVYRRRPSP